MVERLRGGQRGTAILELAMILPVMLLLTVGTLDFGRAIYIQNTLANAARDAARFASVDPSNTSCIRTEAQRHASLANLQSANVTITPPGNVDLGQPVTVSVQASYRPLVAMVASAIGVPSITLRSSATMQIRNVPASSLTCAPLIPTATPVPPTATAVPPTIVVLT